MRRAPFPVAVLMVLALCVLVGFVTGCNPVKKKDAYWKSQVGVATYDDVVAELGPPTAKETLSDKSVVVKWVRISASSTPVRRYGYDSLWTEELVMKFSPTGILMQSSLYEY